MPENVLTVENRTEFRAWLTLHGAEAKECWVLLKRGRPTEDSHFWYLDAVEEALCFGWIDSTLGLVEGVRMQRFSPRAEKSGWTELNKARVRRLERLGLMTDAGRRVLPDMGFSMNPLVEADICGAGVWEQFLSFPELYRRIRAGNLSDTRKRDPIAYRKALEHFAAQTRAGRMYGQWNDYGRLSE